MKTTDVLRAWGRILSGYHPALSIELTKECPLSCPGCYAFQPDHLAGTPLTSVTDFKGDGLVERVLALIEVRRPLVVYFVGGEPLVRFRELSEILPRVSARGIEAHGNTECRGLAATGRADQRDDLAVFHREIDSIERLHVVQLAVHSQREPL